MFVVFVVAAAVTAAMAAVQAALENTRLAGGRVGGERVPLLSPLHAAHVGGTKYGGEPHDGGPMQLHELDSVSGGPGGPGGPGYPVSGGPGGPAGFPQWDPRAGLLADFVNQPFAGAGFMAGVGGGGPQRPAFPHYGGISPYGVMPPCRPDDGRTPRAISAGYQLQALPNPFMQPAGRQNFPLPCGIYDQRGPYVQQQQQQQNQVASFARKKRRYRLCPDGTVTRRPGSYPNDSSCCPGGAACPLCEHGFPCGELSAGNASGDCENGSTPCLNAGCATAPCPDVQQSVQSGAMPCVNNCCANVTQPCVDAQQATDSTGSLPCTNSNHTGMVQPCVDSSHTGMAQPCTNNNHTSMVQPCMNTQQTIVPATAPCIDNGYADMVQSYASIQQQAIGGMYSATPYGQGATHAYQHANPWCYSSANVHHSNNPCVVAPCDVTPCDVTPCDVTPCDVAHTCAGWREEEEYEEDDEEPLLAAYDESRREAAAYPTAVTFNHRRGQVSYAVPRSYQFPPTPTGQLVYREGDDEPALIRDSAREATFAHLRQSLMTGLIRDPSTSGAAQQSAPVIAAPLSSPRIGTARKEPSAVPAYAGGEKNATASADAGGQRNAGIGANERSGAASEKLEADVDSGRDGRRRSSHPEYVPVERNASGTSLPARVAGLLYGSMARVDSLNSASDNQRRQSSGVTTVTASFDVTPSEQPLTSSELLSGVDDSSRYPSFFSSQVAESASTNRNGSARRNFNLNHAASCFGGGGGGGGGAETDAWLRATLISSTDTIVCPCSGLNPAESRRRVATPTRTRSLPKQAGGGGGGAAETVDREKTRERRDDREKTRERRDDRGKKVADEITNARSTQLDSREKKKRRRERSDKRLIAR